MTLDQGLKQVMLETFDTSIIPDLAGKEAVDSAAQEAAELFGVRKPTFNQLKAYLLFGNDAVEIAEEIRFKEQK